MHIEFTHSAWEDLEYWMENDKSMLRKTRLLLKNISTDPFGGIGKLEPLKYELSGWWSRRISGEHRLVYKIEGEKGKKMKCIVIACRFHF